MSSNPSARETPNLDPNKLPTHVAIIMDGNGRWAKQRLLNRIKGHEKGAETVRMVVRTCREIGISHLTLYAFSTENWQRSKVEIEALMALLKRFLRTELSELLENDIRLHAIGQIERLPEDVRRELSDVMRQTENNRSMTLHLALSYGGRAEILQMVQSIARSVLKGEIAPENISEALVADSLYTGGIPDPDLLIRTSGEMRISNFLLWQIAYTELYVTDILWPDFTREALVDILRSYQRRERRFGKVKE